MRILEMRLKFSVNALFNKKTKTVIDVGKLETIYGFSSLLRYWTQSNSIVIYFISNFPPGHPSLE
jgi:hypothetical protein